MLTSEHALELTQLPKSILIIGGGAIGIEWASMLVDFGVEVTVLEYADHILPNEDKDISRELAKVLEKKGIKFITNAKVLAETVQKSSDGATIQVETGEGIKSFTGAKRSSFLLEERRISPNSACKTQTFVWKRILYK